MKFDFIDLVLGVCLLAVVGGFLYGKTGFEEVLTFAGLFVAKKVPAYLEK